jgi:hypothetical protein
LTIPALLCIDVEPDERHVPVPPSAAWRGFEGLAARMDDVRVELTRASGASANFSWFLRLDRQIQDAYGSARWTVDRYGDELRRFQSSGDELGVHAHCWRRTHDGWCNDHGDPSWVSRCVSGALAEFEGAFGHPPIAYRGGDRFIDPTVLEIVERAGVRVDLTLEPGAPATPSLVAGEQATGEIPGVPADVRRPYVPAGSDPFVAGAFDPDRILLVPLLAGMGFSPAGSPYDSIVLWLPPHAFRTLLEQRLQDAPLTHLAFAVRSDVGADELSWRWFIENLRFVASHFGSDIRWTTPEGALADLQASAVAAEPAAAPTSVSPRRLIAAAEALQAAVFDADVAGFHLEGRIRGLEEELTSERARAADECRQRDEKIVELSAATHRLGLDVAAHAARAAALHQDLHDVSTELHRIQPYVARAEALERELSTVRSTKWWRLHDRLQPVLERLGRRRRVRRAGPVDPSP